MKWVAKRVAKAEKMFGGLRWVAVSNPLKY